MNGGRLQAAWMATVKAGDVLISGRGTMRVVRRVNRYQNGKLRSLVFTIKRCSWTNSAFTHLNFTDLRYQGYAPLGVHMPLRSAWDRKISEESCKLDPKTRTIDCCDVKATP
jgi:hypothetical protein